jgi:hypothetical protein
VKVVEVDRGAAGQLQSHESEALRRQTVPIVDIALAPSDPLELTPVVIRNSVQSTTKWNSAGSCCTIWMVVSSVNIRMVVEVLAGV